MKNILSRLALAGIVLALAAGCTGKAAATQPTTLPEETVVVQTEAETEAEIQAPVDIIATLKVGATPAPHAEILEFAKPILAAQGISLEITEFNDYVIPNTSVQDGSLDVNFFQHVPYLDEFNATRGTTLVNVGGVHVEPMGIYVGRGTTLAEIADGAQIGIPGDATNGGRALLLLQAQGLIKLPDDIGLEATPLDITENAHNLVFQELEAAQLPITLPDLDFAVINGNYAIEAGITDKVVALEGAASPYVNILVSRAGDEARPEIQQLLAVLQSAEVSQFITEKYAGQVVPIF